MTKGIWGSRMTLVITKELVVTKCKYRTNKILLLVKVMIFIENRRSLVLSVCTETKNRNATKSQQVHSFGQLSW